MWAKSTIFVLIIISVKFIFKYINDSGDKIIARMKELTEFTEYLRIYSCHMKMSIGEIYDQYDFKSNEVKKVCEKMIESLEEKTGRRDYLTMIGNVLMTPDDFNRHFAEVVDFYGSTYSDILDKKLLYTVNEMENSMKKHEISNSEKKNLNNRISLLVGCLTAVILI
ncbi:hypothetical protein SDC9_59397 [bioreactor metagenome]|uniref:Stage III sporulation protein AB n=2 Tax=root TaxID=1 RepID=A0A562JGT0_9FIRM|nr:MULTISPECIES: hypothetical protein [Sedimentibacter]MEA5094387.1 hypothetical protein [Sedimentibacter saalensis]TWH82446.1 hypothetical protein LY60_00744 [Sedimentibacter saalensis]